MRGIVLVILLLVLPLTAGAQDDKGRIARYLEESLSGLGREVSIEGFRGALSSSVSMDRMTIADEEGVWLVLSGAVLEWNRAAVLRGEIDINQVSAEEIEVRRLPRADDGASPEAGQFSLPELPVSVDIKKIAADRVSLGETIVGTPVVLTLAGAVALAEGQGAADLEITRLEGPRGSFDLKAEYSNATRQLVLDLNLQEAKDGIAANLLNLPGKPAMELTVSGDAPIDDFIAHVALKSDNEERLTGQVSTRTESAADAPGLEQDAPPRIIWADISGDLAPLFAPQYRPFFGPDIALQSLIRLFPDGRVSLEDLSLAAASIRLDGELDLAAGGLPEKFALNALLTDPDSGKVLLPLSGPETRVDRAVLSASFNKAVGDEWALEASLQGLETDGLALEDLQLTGNGIISQGRGTVVSARVDAVAQGIALADAALSRALGRNLSLGADLNWREGLPLELRNLLVQADGATVKGDATIQGLDSAGLVEGQIQAEIGDLSRGADLVGRNIAGRISAKLDGQAEILTGAFDLELNATGTDLSIGEQKIDQALAGDSDLQVSARRDQDGLTLRTARIVAPAGEFETSGELVTDKSNFEFKGALDDLGRFAEGITGPVAFSGEASKHDTGWLIDMEGSGPFQTAVRGRLTLPEDSQPYVKFTALIGAVGAIIPDLPGSAEFTATARQIGDSFSIDATGQGPGGSSLTAIGKVRADASQADLDLNGALPLALLNRRLSSNGIQGMAQFDLRLDGPPAVSSLNGQIRTSGTRFTLPAQGNALTDLDATVDLGGSTANVNASANFATGGRFTATGRVGLLSPNSTDLTVQIVDAMIRDPDLYETVARGTLSLTGAIPENLNVAGGISLDRTEIRVPSSGLGGSGGIPEIVHFNEPADVRRTRQRAGLLKSLEETAAGGGAAIGLDVLVVADSRVFVRGRGLDAELGGRLRLTGTTADVIPVGSFNLIRGRLDILGKRLNLDEGAIRMQGDFVPTLRLVASRVSEDDTQLRIIIEGRADEPEIQFVSDPELPEDEVLARLLFGREIGSLSALQAVQLASAVATLAGNGGTGVVDRIRQNTGLDDLNVGSDNEGNTTLGLGKYISENVYTDVVIGDEANSEINLNIDLSRRSKLRGKLEADGGSGIGIFFEKDY